MCTDLGWTIPGGNALVRANSHRQTERSAASPRLVIVMPLIRCSQMAQLRCQDRG